MVLTTSVLQEGINVKNIGFTDVVFIEDSYFPRPEPLKQFINRFRVKDNDRKYYHYFKERRDQTSWKYEDRFEEDREQLLKKGGLTTYHSKASDDRYLTDKGGVNDFSLMFKSSSDFFRSLNRQEFNWYLTRNYHIDIVQDPYEPEDIKLKKRGGEERQIIAQLIQDDLEGFCGSVAQLSMNPKWKAQFMGQSINHAYIESNLRKCTTILEKYLALQSLHKEPLKLLIDEDGKIDSDQNLSTKLHLLRLQKAYLHPVNLQDQVLQRKLKGFIDKINLKQDLDWDTVNRLWNDITIDKSGYIVYTFIALNSNWGHDRSNGVYFLKENDRDKAKKHSKAWWRHMPVRGQLELFAD